MLYFVGLEADGGVNRYPMFAWGANLLKVFVIKVGTTQTQIDLIYQVLKLLCMGLIK